ncbi:MAG: tetratricopeptide repeat protein [Caldilineaceae bacterium]
MVQEHFGRYEPALEAYEQAIDQLGVLVEHDDADRLYWAKVLKNHAICVRSAFERGLVATDRLESARDDLFFALEIFQAGDEEVLEGRAWNQLGASYRAEGHWDDAIVCYERDRAICERSGDLYGLAASLNNIGEALLGLGRYAEAAPLLETAAIQFGVADDPYEQADTLTNLGRALAGLQQPEAATARFTQAIDRVESLRERMVADVGRMDIFATQMHVYGAGVSHALDQGQAVRSFDIAEKARSRGLLELMKQTQATPTDLPPDLSAQEGELRRQLAQQQGARAEIEAKLAEVHRHMRLVPSAHAAITGADPLRTEEIVARLPPDTALISFFATGDQIVAFCLSTRTGVQVARLPISTNQLTGASFDAEGRVRSLLPGRSRRLPDPWLLARLYDALLRPLSQHFTGHTRLVLVPHGPLFLTPLHAAYDRDPGRYLLEDFDVVYAPSASLAVDAGKPDGRR